MRTTTTELHLAGLGEPDRGQKAARRGLGGAVAEAIGPHSGARIEMLGIQDCFGESGEFTALLAKHGISAAGIEAQARTIVGGQLA